MTQSELYKLFGESNMQNITNLNSWLVLSALVNPAYSSFIGNILYNDGDPIAPCIELARRAFARKGKPEPIFSYKLARRGDKKGKRRSKCRKKTDGWEFPTFLNEKGDISASIANSRLINRWNEEKSVDILDGIDSWLGLYKKVQEMKLQYHPPCDALGVPRTSAPWSRFNSPKSRVFTTRGYCKKCAISS